MEKADNILSTKNLSIGYQDGKKETVVASGINLAFAKAQLIGLIGINGSGKSTLLRTIAGLQQPISGNIQIDGNPLSQFDPSELAKALSIVLTNQPISKNLSVSELVALGRQPYTNWLGTITQADEAAITDALTVTETIALKDHKCYALSDGQLQRVLIARALAQNTSIILLDEPLSHLDLHHKAAVLKLLFEIVHKGKTVLFSTHDIEYALHKCDNLVVLKDNKVILGSPKELIEQGVMTDLFPSDNVSFDSNSKSFKLE